MGMKRLKSMAFSKAAFLQLGAFYAANHFRKAGLILCQKHGQISGNHPSLRGVLKLKLNATLRRSVLLTIAMTAAFVLTACGAISPPGWHSVAVEGDQVLVSSGAAVTALDGTTGTPRWSFSTSSDAGTSTVATGLATNLYSPVKIGANGDLVVTSYSQAIYGISNTGQVLWGFDGNPDRDTIVNSSATLTDTNIHFASGNFLHTLDDAGNLEWTFESDKALWGAPLVMDGTVYQPGMNHTMYALDLNGSELWQTERLVGALASTPALVDGVLISGSLSDHIYGIDPATGSIVWDTQTVGWPWATPVDGGNGMVFIGDLDGNLYAITAATGEIEWQIQLDGSIPSSPTLENDILYVATGGGFLYSIDTADGAINWTAEPEPDFDDQLLASPVLHNDLVIVATTNGDQLVYAFQKANGTLSWIFEG